MAAKTDAAPKGGRRRGQVATVEAIYREVERLSDLLQQTGPSEVFLRKYGQSSPIPKCWRAARNGLQDSVWLLVELIGELEARNEARDARLKVEKRAVAAKRLEINAKCDAIVSTAAIDPRDLGTASPDDRHLGPRAPDSYLR